MIIFRKVTRMETDKLLAYLNDSDFELEGKFYKFLSTKVMRLFRISINNR